MPKISVIMPSLNVQSYIAECLESVLSQTLHDIEVLCVDAGSTDGTLEIITEYQKKDSRIRLIHSDIKSYGHQMNLGLDAATGEYMAILETDDYIASDMYQELYQCAVDNQLDFVKSDYRIFVGEGEQRQFTYMNICPQDSMYDQVVNPREQLGAFNVRMNTWTGLYCIDFLRKHNIRHNETLGASYQDNGFWFQTFMFAERVMFVNKAYYQLRRDNPNSSVHNKGKVFCIFEEYAFIEQILRKEPEKEKALIGMFHKKKFDNCLYHYRRVGEEFKLEFLERMQEEFCAARDAGELRSELFTGNGWKNLNLIMENPMRYMQSSAVNLQSSAVRKKRSLIYRGLICLKDNGLKYTIKNILTKIKRLLARLCR